MDDSGAGWDDQIIEGINWAVQRGARVISMSIGDDRPVGQPYNAVYEQLAASLRQLGKGVLLVASAGNGSNRPIVTAPVEDPAASPSIVAVAAVDNQKMIATFSCKEMDQFGKIDLSAPGAGVYSSWTTGVWWTDWGTSMAAAHVAGVAALYLEQNPQRTADQLESELENSASPLGPGPDYGVGLVHVP
jgi:subtilisin family serine protease